MGLTGSWSVLVHALWDGASSARAQKGRLAQNGATWTSEYTVLLNVTTGCRAKLRVLLEKWLTLHGHTNVPPNQAHSLLLLQYKSCWNTQELFLIPLKSDTQNPDSNVASLIHCLPNHKKNFYIKISLFQLRGAHESNDVPLPACTSPASLSNKGRLVSHPVSINSLLAITNSYFDVHTKCFSTSQPEWTCSVVEPQCHTCRQGKTQAGNEDTSKPVAFQNNF